MKSNLGEQFVAIALGLGAIELLPEGRTLKSGRMSPYFFNSGLFSNGRASAILTRSYASACTANHLPENTDVLFGPAYKGTLLVASVAEKLSEYFPQISFASNRKEAKDHGEGGTLLGEGLKGKSVVIIDDVMTTGGSCAEAVGIIRKNGGTPIGCVIAFDRQERGTSGSLSATQEFAKKFGIPVFAIATLTDLISCLHIKSEEKDGNSYGKALEKILAYQSEYGVS